MSDDGFSLKPRFVARNKTSINVIVVDGVYFPFTVLITQQDVIDTDRTGIFLPLLYFYLWKGWSSQASPNFTNNSMLN